MDVESEFLSVEFTNNFTGAHVGTNHFMRNVVECGIVYKILVAVGVKIVGDDVESFASSPYC